MDGRAEFIGENVTISHHSDPSLCGVSGMIVDETREIVTLSSSDGIKRVSKTSAMFKFETGRLNGDLLKHRPQDRIRKVKI